MPLLVAVLTAHAANADEAWQHTDTRNGVTYEKRSVPGTKFLEYRATFDTTMSPIQVLDVVWGNLSLPPGPHITKRIFLKKTADEMLIHDDIHTPVVSDRELTLRFVREPDAVRFETHNELGPPPQRGRVQLPLVRGSWVVTPVGTGSHVTYMCYSEPGGSVPAFMVRGTQQAQIPKDVEHVREHLK